MGVIPPLQLIKNVGPCVLLKIIGNNDTNTMQLNSDSGTILYQKAYQLYQQKENLHIACL